MDVFAKPDPLDADVVANLGPLASLAGVWEGDQGVDTAPSADGPLETRFRERLVLEPMGPVVNGPQVLYGLRYSTVAWPLGEDAAFHEETGYWLWDPGSEIVMRCFVVPRGVTVEAGGHAAPRAKVFEMAAEAGSGTFGILENPFLKDAFHTVRYEVEVTIHAADRFSYAEDTVLKIAGTEDLFHHTDSNTLTKP